jgi:hypothetical protein
MARMMIAPTTDTSMLGLTWLDNYFNNYGDVIPNADLIKLNGNFKKVVYTQYVKETKSHGKNLTYSRFCSIWNVLFPNCINRPWCNIPGKCDTCYLIDKGRRNSQSIEEQKYYQQCHAIHKGCLFNLERKK